MTPTQGPPTLVRKILGVLQAFAEGTPCGHCGGQGWYQGTGSEHHPSCDGSCYEGMCPVPVPIQVECKCNGGYDAPPNLQVKGFLALIPDGEIEADEKRTAALEKIAEAANGEEVWQGIVASGMPGRWETEGGEVQDANVQVELFRNIKLKALKDLHALTPAPKEKEEA